MPIKLSAEAKHAFAERVLTSGASLPLKMARRYDEAKMSTTVGTAVSTKSPGSRARSRRRRTTSRMPARPAPGLASCACAVVGTAAALHVAALLPKPIPDCGLGMSRFFARDVCPPPPLEGGRMRVPTAPGLGVDPEAFWRANA